MRIESGFEVKKKQFFNNNAKSKNETKNRLFQSKKQGKNGEALFFESGIDKRFSLIDSKHLKINIKKPLSLSLIKALELVREGTLWVGKRRMRGKEQKQNKGKNSKSKTD